MTPIEFEAADRSLRDFLKHGDSMRFAAPSGSESPSLLMDEPWPLRDILAKLVEAADILLDDKDYDGHGWEEIAGCRDRAKAILATQNSVLNKPGSLKQ